MKSIMRTIIFSLLIILSNSNAFSIEKQNIMIRNTKQVSFSTIYTKAMNDEVISIKKKGDGVFDVYMKNGDKLSVTTPIAFQWPYEIIKKGVEVNYEIDTQKETTIGNVISIIFSFLVPTMFFVLLMIMTWVLLIPIISKFRIGNLMKPGKLKTRFEDVAGAEEAKEALKDIVEYLKNPKTFGDIGARNRKGILLVGDPGNGKTLVARAVAGEANVPFFSVSGAEFQEMYVGMGASRVRRIFKTLRKKAPVILFIDEIDSVGIKRRNSATDASTEYAQTLNQLLTELDGLAPSSGIVIIGATNRVDVLDPALIRPGRFDLQVYVPPPDIKAREKIIKLNTENIIVDKNVDFSTLAKATPGFSGADLASMVNEAAIYAAKKNKQAVSMEDFEEARDSKIMGGSERRGQIISKKEMEIIRYHESGHALASILQDECDPIHKGTIIPRGKALGFVSSLPENENVLTTKSKLKAALIMTMAGRAAEEIKFGKDNITTGASSDIQKATMIAREMVTKYGMSEKLMMYNGPEISQFGSDGISETTKREIDLEIEKIIQDAYEKAKKIIEQNMQSLEKLAKEFEEKETLTGKEIKDIVCG